MTTVAGGFFLGGGQRRLITHHERLGMRLIAERWRTNRRERPLVKEGVFISWRPMKTFENTTLHGRQTTKSKLGMEWHIPTPVYTRKILS